MHFIGTSWTEKDAYLKDFPLIPNALHFNVNKTWIFVFFIFKYISIYLCLSVFVFVSGRFFCILENAFKKNIDQSRFCFIFLTSSIDKSFNGFFYDYIESRVIYLSWMPMQRAILNQNNVLQPEKMKRTVGAGRIGTKRFYSKYNQLYYIFEWFKHYRTSWK